MKCTSCGNEVSPEGRFCTYCGAVLPEDPQKQQEYKRTIQQYLLDGVLEPWEVRELALLRRQLNISDKTHKELLSTFDYVDHNTISIEIDISNIRFFRAQQQCQFRVQIRNIETYPIRQCTVVYQVRQGGTFFQSSSIAIASKTQTQLSLPFIPQYPGQYELFGHIDIDDAQGRSYRYQFRNIPFNVSAAHVQHIQNITVGDNFTGVLDIQSPEDENQIEGGLNLSEDWAEVSLKPVPRMRDGVFQKAAFCGQFAPQNTCILQFNRNDTFEKVEVFALDSITMGRDQNRCTTKLALEPFLPAHIHHHNFQQSQRISGKHLSFMKKDNMVHVCDLSSKLGTMRNGKPCYQLSFYPIHTGDRISIAQVLEFEAHVHFKQAEHESIPTSLLLKRTNNAPEKSHLLLFEAIGIWPAHPSILGPLRVGVTEAPLQLRRVDNRVYLCNSSSGTILIQGYPLHNGESAPLSNGQLIQTQGLSINVSNI